MTEMPSLMRLATQAARHASARQAVIAANVANSDTPGFRPSDMGAFRPDAGRLPLRRTDPRHLAGASPPAEAALRRGAAMDPNGNGVSLEEEILLSVETGRAHGRALAVYQASLDLIRSSLGRR